MTTISTKRKDKASANASQENVNHIKKKSASISMMLKELLHMSVTIVTSISSVMRDKK